MQPRMMPHPTPVFSDLYASYAAGCLDPAFALMLETQAELRPDLSRTLRAHEAISGICLETAEQTRLRGGALNEVLAVIDEIDLAGACSCTAARAASAAMDEILALPEPLRAAAIDAIGQKGWDPMGRGLKRLALSTSSRMEVELYRISPGASIPRHSHKGSEYTLVVAGGFSDERGSYGPGDVVINGPEDTHQPIGDEGDICYALAIRDGGLRFTGVMGLIQRLVGAR